LRILSTVPSITELLFELGLETEVVGITKFCIHPRSWFESKPRIGGTKNLNLSKIKSLNPTLLICNKEENVKEQIDEISTYCKVLVTDIKTFQDNIELIEQLGELCDKRMTAIRLMSELKAAKESITRCNNLRTAYLIWKAPYMTVGRDTYIHDMMQHCGLINVFTNKTRYPTTSIEELDNLDLDLLLLSSEPYPFKDVHISELNQLLPNIKIHLVDGEVFSWYGTRLIKQINPLNGFLSRLNSDS